MPEEEFEVRGAHEEALEHAAEHGIGLGQEIALFSAVLATLGAGQFGAIGIVTSIIAGT